MNECSPKLQSPEHSHKKTNIKRGEKMKYLTETERLNCNVYSSQKAKLENIKQEIKEEHNLYVPISELVRRCIEIGLPIIDEDRSYINELIE